MIPKVKDWNVTVIGDDGIPLTRVVVSAPNKVLARLNFRHDFYQYWGMPIRVSIVRGASR